MEQTKVEKDESSIFISFNDSALKCVADIKNGLVSVRQESIGSTPIHSVYLEYDKIKKLYKYVLEQEAKEEANLE